MRGKKAELIFVRLSLASTRRPERHCYRGCHLIRFYSSNIYRQQCDLSWGTLKRLIGSVGAGQLIVIAWFIFMHPSGIHLVVLYFAWQQQPKVNCSLTNTLVVSAIHFFVPSTTNRVLVRIVQCSGFRVANLHFCTWLHFQFAAQQHSRWSVDSGEAQRVQMAQKIRQVFRTLHEAATQNFHGIFAMIVIPERFPRITAECECLKWKYRFDHHSPALELNVRWN